MKIFIDAHFLDGRKHGVAIYLERLYSHYRLLRPNDELYFGIEPNVVADYHLFSLPRVHVLKYRFGGILRFLFDIPLLVRQIGADVVHTQNVLPLRIGYSALRHVTLYDVLYEDFPELFGTLYRWSRRLIFGLSARNADQISTISEYSKERIITLYRPKASKVHIIYPGVVEDESSNTLINYSVRRENNILYVSRFERRKNHLALLRVFVKLRNTHPSLRMTLVGFDVDGSLLNIKKFISKFSLEDCVDIKSNILDGDLKTLYQTSKVIVYPSFCEGFGMPVIESFLLNPNTFYSNTTAMSEFSFATDNSFNPGDDEDIERKIRIGLRSESDNSHKWANQRQYITGKYNWKRSAKVLIQIHDQISDVNKLPKLNQS